MPLCDYDLRGKEHGSGLANGPSEHGEHGQGAFLSFKGLCLQVVTHYVSYLSLLHWSNTKNHHCSMICVMCASFYFSVNYIINILETHTHIETCTGTAVAAWNGFSRFFAER